MVTRGLCVGLVAAAIVWAGSALGGPAAPAPAAMPAAPAAVPGVTPDRLQDLLEQLRQAGELLRQTNDPPAIATYSLRQADVVTQILGVAKAEERDLWVRHLAGCLATAALNGPAHDQTAYQRLAGLGRELARVQPGSVLAAHVAFLELQTGCVLRLTVPGADVTQSQEYRRQRLAQFVEAYPQGEDAPAALAELARESAGQEAETRERYRQLAESFPHHPLAAQARAALRRLELPGQEIDLTLPFLNDPSQPYHASRLGGKVAVVYCWSSADPQCGRNREVLRLLLEEYGGRGLTVVMVNLDKTPGLGQAAWQADALPAVELYAEGGLEGDWAKRHGVADVPTMFLVGKEGRVVTQVLDQDGLAQQLRKQFRVAPRGAQR